MILGRNLFFLILLLLVTGPFIIYKAWWMAGSKKSTGVVSFIGHGNLGSALGMSTYPVIRFRAGADSLYFNSNVNLSIHPGQKVAVRYLGSNPRDARVDNFACIWAETLIYALFPVLILLVLYCTPDRLGPVFPRKARIRVGISPFLRLLFEEQ
jgi:hypothetical protein